MAIVYNKYTVVKVFIATVTKQRFNVLFAVLNDYRNVFTFKINIDHVRVVQISNVNLRGTLVC